MPINNMCLNSDSSRQNELWTLISSCSLWHIWKARCQRLFGNIVVPPGEVIRSTWQEMVITLRAKYLEGLLHHESELQVGPRSTTCAFG